MYRKGDMKLLLCSIVNYIMFVQTSRALAVTATDEIGSRHDVLRGYKSYDFMTTSMSDECKELDPQCVECTYCEMIPLRDDPKTKVAR
jgi:hypothetical protein